MTGEFLSSRATARHALFFALTAIAAATLLISDAQARAQTTAVITLSITSESAYIAEDGGSATITATLDRPAPEAVHVGIGHDGSANNTADYRTLLPFFLKGQQTATFRIIAKDDEIDEPDETVEITAFLRFRDRYYTNSDPPRHRR